MNTEQHHAPNNIDAETAIIEALIEDSAEFLPRLRNVVDETFFYDPPCREIWKAVIVLQESNQPVDLVTVSHHLRINGLLDKCEERLELRGTSIWMRETDRFTWYLRQIQQAALQRKLMRTAQGIIDMTASFGQVQEQEEQALDFAGLLAKCETLVFDVGEEWRRITQGKRNVEFRDHQDVQQAALDEIEEVLANPGVILPRYVATGFTDLDRTLCGMKPGQLVIIAARPAMGKTSLAENIFTNVALGLAHYPEGAEDRRPKRVAVVSLEMSAEEIVKRQIVGGAGVSMQMLHNGFVKRQEQDAITKRYRETQDALIRWLDTPGITVQDLASKLRKEKAAKGLDLVVIDYLQLLRSGSSRARQGREVEIAEISVTLKGLAKELGIPIIVLAQLNRKAEERAQSKPQLADIRDSGAIEQDADVVILLWRESYYNDEADPEKATAIVAKHRGGPVGDVELRWEASHTRFDSLTDRLYSNNQQHRQVGTAAHERAPHGRKDTTTPPERKPMPGEYMPAPED